MTDRRITIPSLYMGQPDAELTLETPDGERGTMALVVEGVTLASAGDFNAPQIGPSLLEQSDAQLAGMFGGFLAHALESSEPDARDGWEVLLDDASDWTDALALMEADELESN